MFSFETYFRNNNKKCIKYETDAKKICNIVQLKRWKEETKDDRKRKKIRKYHSGNVCVTRTAQVSFSERLGNTVWTKSFEQIHAANNQRMKSENSSAENYGEEFHDKKKIIKNV